MQVPEFRQDKVCEEGEEEEDVRDGAADGVGQRVEDVQGLLIFRWIIQILLHS